MPGTIINQLLIERYKQLVNQRYVEPREAEEIIGTFLHMPDIAVKVVPAEPRKKKSKSTNNKSVVKSTSTFELFLRPIMRLKEAEKKNNDFQDKNVVVIDD